MQMARMEMDCNITSVSSLLSCVLKKLAKTDYGFSLFLKF